MTGLRKRQKMERHNRILEAARTQLNDTDYRSITVEAIAQGADVSPMTVFNYFGSKGGLLLALVAESDQLLVKKIEQHIDTDQLSAFDALVRFSHIIIDHAFSYLDRKTWSHVISTAILEGNSGFGKRFMELELELVMLLAQLIEKLGRYGLLQVDGDSQDIATIVYNVHNARFIEFASNQRITHDDIKALVETDLGLLTRPMLTVPD